MAVSIPYMGTGEGHQKFRLLMAGGMNHTVGIDGHGHILEWDVSDQYGRSYRKNFVAPPKVRPGDNIVVDLCSPGNYQLSVSNPSGKATIAVLHVDTSEPLSVGMGTGPVEKEEKGFKDNARKDLISQIKMAGPGGLSPYDMINVLVHQWELTVDEADELLENMGLKLKISVSQATAEEDPFYPVD